MALEYLSRRRGRTVTVREMAENLHCPFDSLSRALQQMAEKGFVRSQKGIGGGYLFSGDLRGISFYDLMSAILQPVEVIRCLSGDCDLFETCNIRTPLRIFNARLKDFYRSLSLEEILNPSAGGPARKKTEKRPAGQRRITLQG